MSKNMTAYHCLLYNFRLPNEIIICFNQVDNISQGSLYVALRITSASADQTEKFLVFL
jgi:hypothetical protein